MDNFKFIKNEYIQDVASDCRYYRHTSGAKIIYLKNEDINSVFAIAFGTEPNNNCGTPHIVEHCTLCGSESYRLKDPFNVLDKGIIHTYLNAITYPDITLYPVAGTNEQDFFTMVKVYMDAVFKPLFFENEGIFLQEGWHCGNEGISGVVYNEMKGVFSQPHRVLKHKLQEILYKNTPYEYYSGGIPESIPKLSYSEFLNYYKEKYHPSNSIIYLYGNIDTEKYFKLIDGYISKYTQKKYGRNIQLNKNSGEISFNIENNNKNYLMGIFNTGTALDYELNFTFSVLNEALFNSNNSPLKNELQKLGAVVKGEFDSFKYYPDFTIYVENTQGTLKEFKSVINNFINNGSISEKLIKSAINRVKFYINEEDFGYKPKGLYYGLRAINGFIYDNEDFTPLKFNKLFDNIEKMDFMALLRKYLYNGVYGEINIDMPVIKTEKLKKSVNKEKLIKYQDTEDKIEELVKISPVKPQNISNDIFRLNSEIFEKFIFVPMDKEDVVYIDFAFDLTGLRESLISYTGIYRYAAQRINTALTEKIDMYMGELNFSFATFSTIDGYKPMLMLRGKFLRENLNKAMDCFKKLLFDVDFSDCEKLKILVNEQRQKMIKSLITNGNNFAVNYSLSCCAERYKYGEMVTGIDYLEFLLNENNIKNISISLNEIKNSVFNKNNCIITFGCGYSFKESIYKAVSDIYNNLGSNILKDIVNLGVNTEKAVYINSSVNYNALAGKIKSFNGYYKVVKQVIMSFIWDNIRLCGGAYGGSCDFYRSGLFKLSSYRDPRALQTFADFEKIPDYIADLKLSRDEVDRYIIGAVSNMDMPVKNNVKTVLALNNYLSNITDSMLYEERQQVLNCTLYHIQKYGNEINFNNIYKTSVGNEKTISDSKLYNKFIRFG